MPCYYTGSAEGDAELRAEESRKLVTELTQMLCSLCEKIPEKDLPQNVAKWYKKHRKVDEERVRKLKKEHESKLNKIIKLREQANKLEKELEDE